MKTKYPPAIFLSPKIIWWAKIILESKNNLTDYRKFDLSNKNCKMASAWIDQEKIQISGNCSFTIFEQKCSKTALVLFAELNYLVIHSEIRTIMTVKNMIEQLRSENGAQRFVFYRFCLITFFGAIGELLSLKVKR